MKEAIKALKNVRSLFDRDISRELGQTHEYMTWDTEYIQVKVVKYLISREITKLKRGGTMT